MRGGYRGGMEMKRAIASLLCVIRCVSFLAAADDIRPAAVAGQFYPANRTELTTMVDGFLAAAAPPSVSGRPIGLLAPHAGYVYSGATAGIAHRLLAGSGVTTVVLLGNSHHFRLAKAAVYPSGSFVTPLGSVPVNKTLAGALIARPALFEADARPHMPEHSLEVQLPFLQRTLKDFSIVPVLFSDMSLDQCKACGEAIAAALKESGLEKNAVIIASSDMSHYPSWANANMTDSAALKALAAFDPPQLRQSIAMLMAGSVPNLDCVFCGPEALSVAMYASRSLGASRAAVLAHATSADASGDRGRVVGYGAAAFIDPKQKYTPAKLPSKEKQAMKAFSISAANQKKLLDLARGSIAGFLKNKVVPELKTADPELAAPAAVFVTLTQRGNLRGCIGTTTPQAPLGRAVCEMAVAAATEDYRFSPVAPAELKDIRIEISVLSPMTRVRSADEIHAPAHGVVVRSGMRSGLFLPQVWEHFSRKEDFLDELCSQKAGLRRDAWKDPATELYVFTVFAFEED